MKIEVKYSLPNRDVDLKVIDAEEPREIGLPKRTAAFKVSISHRATPPTNHGIPQPKAGDTAYSGSHDTGPLCPPREGGIMATVIHGVQRAKELNDTFLTSIIKAEQHPSKSPPTKKLKADDTS